MKSLSKAVLALYLLILLWLVLFKFSFDFASVLLDHQMRSLSLIPFADSLRGETISNFMVFIPLGLLLSVNLKQVTVLRKLACIFILSIAVEVIQFILAIGVTDITDVIMNTFGGFVGLLLYDLFNKYVNSKKLDRFIVIACMILLLVFMLLRFLVFRVKY